MAIEIHERVRPLTILGLPVYGPGKLRYNPALPDPRSCIDFATKLGFDGVMVWIPGGSLLQPGTDPAASIRLSMTPFSPLSKVPWPVRSVLLSFPYASLWRGVYDGTVAANVVGESADDAVFSWQDSSSKPLLSLRIKSLIQTFPDADAYFFDDWGNLASWPGANGPNWGTKPGMYPGQSATPKEEGLIEATFETINNIIQKECPGTMIGVEPCPNADLDGYTWWGNKLPAMTPYVQRVDLSLRRSHFPREGERATSDLQGFGTDFFVLTAGEYTFDELKGFIEDCHYTGANAIIQWWELAKALKDHPDLPKSGDKWYEMFH